MPTKIDKGVMDALIRLNAHRGLLRDFNAVDAWSLFGWQVKQSPYYNDEWGHCDKGKYNTDMEKVVDWALAQSTFEIEGTLESIFGVKCLRCNGSRVCHKCVTCGCQWKLNPPIGHYPHQTWSLADASQQPGKECCDNVKMTTEEVPCVYCDEYGHFSWRENLKKLRDSISETVTPKVTVSDKKPSEGWSPGSFLWFVENDWEVNSPSHLPGVIFDLIPTDCEYIDSDMCIPYKEFKSSAEATEAMNAAVLKAIMLAPLVPA